MGIGSFFSDRLLLGLHLYLVSWAFDILKVNASKHICGIVCYEACIALLMDRTLSMKNI